MGYATVDEVQARMMRQMGPEERSVCENLLEDAARLIDAYNSCAQYPDKKVVSIRVVQRALGDGNPSGGGYPLGATQGSMSALGYSQSWTIGGGAAGELYLGKTDKKLLGYGDRIGSKSPTQDMRPAWGRIWRPYR